MKKIIGIAVVLICVFLMGACGGSKNASTSSPGAAANKAGRANVQAENKSLVPPKIKNFTDYHNYMNAQALYDDQSSIIWCTTTWGNASAPLVTIPIAGKLTSSTVSLFPSTQTVYMSDRYGPSSFNSELPSVDAMYHGSPPPYRYGFTPGGQYVDFFNMPVVCTTALTSFQRQSTKVSITTDAAADNAQKAAKVALQKCQAADTSKTTVTPICPAAQAALQAIATGGN